MDLTKEFSLKGKWWIPYNGEDKDKDENSLYGELSYSLQSGIKLQVYGSFKGSKNTFTAQHNFLIPHLRGLTQQGECVTIMNAFGHEIGSDHLLETTLTPDYIVHNPVYYFDPESVKFDQTYIHLNCNESFFSRLYKRLEIEQFDKEGDVEKLQHIKTLPKNIYQDDSIESFLFFSYGFRYSSPGENEFMFSQKVFINSVLKEPKNFEECIRFAKVIKSIFVFFTEQKIYFNRLRFKEQNTQEIFDVIFHQPNRKNFQNLRMMDMLCQYDDFDGSFETLFGWFIRNRNFVEEGLSLYLQLRELKIESIPQQFLSIVFALETLHTSFFSEPPFAKEEYQEFKRQKATFQIDHKFKKRLSECLSHFNTQSFADRINSLIDKNNNLISEYIYDNSDFVLKIKNQRNFFAHNHTGSSTKLIKQEDFGYFIQMCKLIYDVNFLKLAGVETSAIKKTIKASFFNKYFKNKMFSSLNISNR